MDLHLLENFRLMKLGPGLVSKNLWALVAIEAALTAGMFATKSDPIHIGILATMLVVFLSNHVFNVLLVRKRPELALLEGAQLVNYYRSSQGLIGKGDVAYSAGIENPEHPVQLSAGRSKPR